MPGPWPPEIDAEHHELERLVCAHKTGQELVRRARVVLLVGMGYGNTAIAEQIPLEVEAVGLWRRPVQRRVVPVERANLELLILASMEALAQMDDHCAPAEALKSLVMSAVQGGLSRFLMGWLEDARTGATSRRRRRLSKKGVRQWMTKQPASRAIPKHCRNRRVPTR